MGRGTEYLHAVRHGLLPDELEKYTHITIDDEFRQHLAEVRRMLKKNAKTSDKQGRLF